jgi:hypothetical protein
MDRIHTSNLTQFLHGRIESTNVLPIPSISWIDIPTQQLRQAWRAVPVTIESLPVEELCVWSFKGGVSLQPWTAALNPGCIDRY